jgi:hypothetical protein
MKSPIFSNFSQIPHVFAASFKVPSHGFFGASISVWSSSCSGTFKVYLDGELHLNVRDPGGPHGRFQYVKLPEGIWIVVNKMFFSPMGLIYEDIYILYLLFIYPMGVISPTARVDFRPRDPSRSAPSRSARGVDGGRSFLHRPARGDDALQRCQAWRQRSGFGGLARRRRKSGWPAWKILKPKMGS